MTESQRHSHTLCRVGKVEDYYGSRKLSDDKRVWCLSVLSQKASVKHEACAQTIK